MTNNLFDKKLARFASGGSPKVVDLFSGCGGLSLGFHRAGCELLAGVELDPHAARTYALNFHGNESEEIRSLHAKPRNICVQDPVALLREFGCEDPAAEVDFIIGGPPCQAYARVGRAKLREVRDHHAAFKVDRRGSLFEHYLRYVAALRPLALLMENVPDILNYGGDNVAEVICEGLESLGYRVTYTLLNAAAYGVPQTRERFFLLAWDKRISEIPPSFPQPIHNLDELPVGYRGTRAVARQLKKALEKAATKGYTVPNHYDPCNYLEWSGLDDPVSTLSAVDDLPEITGHLTGTIKRGARRFDEHQAYTYEPHSAFARLMREEWLPFTNEDGIRDHVIRFLPRDFRIFRKMNPGDQYPEAHIKALQLCDAEKRRREKRLGRPLKPKEINELTKEFVPPYDATKFPNKWRKLEEDRPARTLMAHLGHDSYSHIHYDSKQARTISVREAARLQSFPDGFVFSGTMNPAFRMIGNAVPPLAAFALADHMIAEIQNCIGYGKRELAAGGY
jgi:DNA (cytosine-5)-methyltransferase 1